ncbi:MAG TPA: substrate-binding domain-containing protein [Phycisphaerae bacterium]|nr:substrate-binding domain-containing protein [Phycisphaerae bacterium]
MRTWILALGLSLIAALGISGCGKSESPSTTGGGPKAKRIAVIPKGTTHEFWKSIHAGANKAADEQGKAGHPVEILWKGPLKEGDSTAQVDVVRNMISLGVDGIVLAPNDKKNLAKVIGECDARHIPVVIIDSDVESDAYKSFVATDNEKGGYLGGQELAKSIGSKGKVIMLRYMEGSASTEGREAGFLKAMKENPGIQVVSDRQFGGDTADSAQRAADNLLAGYKNADGSLSIDGIFTPNESTTFGMLRALETIHAAGKVKFVGFDSSEKLMDGLKSGEIQGLVLQNPFRMGYLGVNTVMDVLNGKTVEKRIDTGVGVATKANLDAPELQETLHPDLAKWLKE